MFAADKEAGAEVYSGATSEKQAWEVFRPALQMARASPAFREHYGAETFKQSIAIIANGSRFEPLIGKPGDGASPNCAIVDEYHEHDDDSLAQTMLTGMGAREQPLIMFISTAGENTAGPCYQLMLEAQRMLDGLVQDDELFALTYGLDKDDDWADPAMLRKANPNYGISVSEDFLLARHADAMANARQQGIYQIKHLNRWVGAKAPFFDLPKWLACKQEIRLEQFHGRRALLGLDLASTVDVNALVLLLREGEQYTAFGRFYLPEATVERSENKHLQAWQREGHLIVTPGQIVDMEWIRDDILDLARQFEIAELGYDPFQATMLVTMLVKAGISCVEVRPTVLNFSQPMKQLDGLIRSGKIAHDGCPVMTWMIGNVTAHRDAKDNVYPRKARDENKIDGVVALLMALARSMVVQEKLESVYERLARIPADTGLEHYERVAAMQREFDEEEF
jgi:phage terminase large subunit-like protein